jgi:hypothetical protein
MKIYIGSGEDCCTDMWNLLGVTQETVTDPTLPSHSARGASFQLESIVSPNPPTSSVLVPQPLENQWLRSFMQKSMHYLVREENLLTR